MIDISELAYKVEQILNNIATNKQLDLFFKVKTPASFIDSVADNQTHKNFIPVFIDLPDGEYDAIPNVNIVAQTHRITFYFPLSKKIDIQTYLNFVAKEFVAKTIRFGALSGYALCNISAPEFNGVDIEQFREFKEFIGTTYRNTIDDSEYYGMYSLTLFTTSVEKLNQENGLLMCNEIKYGISFESDNKYYSCGNNTKYIGQISSVGDLPEPTAFEIGTLASVKNGGLYRVSQDVLQQQKQWVIYKSNGNYFIEKDNFVWVDTSDQSSGNPITQQLIGEKKSSSIVNTTNYARSFLVLFKNTPFWKKFVELYNNGDLQNQGFEIYKDYGFANYTFNQTNIDIQENIGLGDFLSYTISFVDKATY